MGSVLSETETNALGSRAFTVLGRYKYKRKRNDTETRAIQQELERVMVGKRVSLVWARNNSTSLFPTHLFQKDLPCWQSFRRRADFSPADMLQSKKSWFIFLSDYCSESPPSMGKQFPIRTEGCPHLWISHRFPEVFWNHNQFGSIYIYIYNLSTNGSSRVQTLQQMSCCSVSRIIYEWSRNLFLILSVNPGIGKCAAIRRQNPLGKNVTNTVSPMTWIGRVSQNSFIIIK